MTPDTVLADALAGRYALRREIGAGGMSTVYLADDLRHGRQVAIKVLKPDIARAIGHERFLREIEIAAGLRHPNILPLFDSGGADGLLYYIMPFVEGASLRERLEREKQIPIEEALRIVSEVADALDYAHERDVIHRDIKPENILLERGRAFVADFGVARAVTAAESTRMTQSGSMIGTVAYMSPEQSSGAAEVDGRSDLYSLACVLYEMIAGEAPFAGPTMEAILVRRFTEPAPRLSAARPGTPTPIDSAIQRALARDPSERYATAARFAEALTARGSAPETSRENSIAVLPFTNSSGVTADEYFSDGVAEEIINVLSHVPGLKVAARTSSFSFKGKQEDLRSIGEKLNVQTVLEGSVRKAGSRLRITAQLVDVRNGYQLWSERYDRELTDVFEIQDDIATSIAERFKIATAPDVEGEARRGTENLEAYEAFLKGRAFLYKRGQYIWAAIDCFDEAIRLDPEYTAAMGWLSDAHQLTGVYGLRPPAESMLKARAIAERALALNPDQDEAHATLADVAATFDRDEAAAFRHWERALELNPSQIRARSRCAMWGYGLIRRDYERAIREGMRSCEEDPRNSFACGTLAHIFGYARRFDEALLHARRAVELEPDSFYARYILVQATSWTGAHGEAIAAGKRLLSVSGRHPWALGALAMAYARAGEPEMACAIQREMEARSTLEYVQKSTIAMAAISAGNVDRAVELIREGLEERDALLKQLPDHPGFERFREHPAYEELCRRIASP